MCVFFLCVYCVFVFGCVEGTVEWIAAWTDESEMLLCYYFVLFFFLVEKIYEKIYKR